MSRVLCVCLGNICRSPLMQGALEAACAQAGIAAEVDSAGLGGWHEGETPDARAVRAGAARGLDISAQRARQVAPEDFAAFDLILTAEDAQAARLRAGAPAACAEIAAMLSFGPGGDIPDPYYGGAQDFEQALDLIEAALPGVLARLSPRD